MANNGFKRDRIETFLGYLLPGCMVIAVIKTMVIAGYIIYTDKVMPDWLPPLITGLLVWLQREIGAINVGRGEYGAFEGERLAKDKKELEEQA